MGQLIQLIQMLPEHVVGLLQIGLWGAVALLIASQMGFFRAPTALSDATEQVHLSQLLLAFTIYLSVQLVLLPALAVAWASTIFGDAQVDAELSKPNVEGWLNFAGIVVVFPLLIGYSVRRVWVVWERWPHSYQARLRDVVFGAFIWFLAFPIVTAVAEGMKDFSRLLVQAPTLDQVAVRHLKSAVGDPLLTVVSVLAIVLLVPVIEELLFRGFLQSWLVSRFTPFTSIVLSSAIFTMVHFSPSQGIANAELMTGLFLLALFLGYLYQRQGSLWASIGLHCTFNAVSVTMILMGVGS